MGSIFHSGIQYLGSGITPIELTKAEYDALPTSEKENPAKVYYVKDYDPFPADIIDDTTTALDKVWSSSKTSSELQTTNNNVYNVTTKTSCIFNILGKDVTLPVTSSYMSALLVIIIHGIGSCVMSMYVTGNTISKTFISGNQTVVNSLTITKTSSGYNFTANGQTVQGTAIFSSLS